MANFSVPLRRSSRAHVSAKGLTDYDYRGKPQLYSINTSSHTSPHDLDKVFSYNHLSDKHYVFSNQLDNLTSPTTQTEVT